MKFDPFAAVCGLCLLLSGTLLYEGIRADNLQRQLDTNAKIVHETGSLRLPIDTFKWINISSDGTVVIKNNDDTYYSCMKRDAQQ